MNLDDFNQKILSSALHADKYSMWTFADAEIQVEQQRTAGGFSDIYTAFSKVP